MYQFLASVQKALIPLAVAGVAVALEAIGVNLPGDQVQQIGAGLVNSGLVWLFPNGKLGL